MQPYTNQPYTQQPQPIYAQPTIYQEPAKSIDEHLIGVYSTEDYASEHFGFLQKVYSLVTFQLLITFIMIFLASYVEVIGDFFRNTWVFVIGLIGMISFLIITFFARNKVPLNYITLIGFTISMGTMVAGIAAFIEPVKVFQAIALTLIISTALTITTFAMGSRTIVWVLFLIIVLCSTLYFLLFYFIFTKSDAAHSICVSIVGLIYGCYLVLDTYVIKTFADFDDYIIAAVMIYIDIIRILIILLAVMGERGNQR